MGQTVTYIISRLTDSHEMREVAQRLDKVGYDIHFLLLNTSDSTFEQFLRNHNIPVHRIHYSGKKDSLKSLWRLYRWLRHHQPEIVHTHLVEASLLGLLAAWMARIPHRFHTRHHSTFHHDYFPSAVKYDRWVNRLSTHIVAISQNVKQVLVEQENVAPTNISLIHHGIALKKFQNVNSSSVQSLREKYTIPEKGPVIGMIGKYVRLKGHQYVIEAFQKFLEEEPAAHLVIANAQGPDKAHVHRLLGRLSKERFTEIRFESDIYALYQLFDLFVHAPINPKIEAFGQVYIEALAAGTPSVFTLSGVAPEFIEHLRNAYVADFQSAKSILKGLQTLNTEPETRQQLIEQGQQDAQQFRIDNMINKLRNLYERN